MFSWDGWGVLEPLAGFTVWSYRTADPLSETIVPGYFNPLRRLPVVQREDWIVGWAKGEQAIEVVITELEPEIVTMPLHDWFEDRVPGPTRH